MLHRLVFSWRGALLGVLASVAAVGLAGSTAAAATVTSLTSCQDINTPGKYRLDADVSTGGPPGAVCFEIVANSVRLNLNGHTITAAGQGAGGIVVAGSGDNIVGPGTVSNFVVGIDLRASYGSVRGVTVTGNAVGIRFFLASSVDNSVRGNVATGNNSGIQVNEGPTDNTIIGNYAHNNRSGDLVDFNANCDSNVWRGNDFGTANQSCIH